MLEKSTTTATTTTKSEQLIETTARCHPAPASRWFKDGTREVTTATRSRWGRHPRSGTPSHHRDVIDYRTGYIRSHLRSPSGRVR